MNSNTITKTDYIAYLDAPRHLWAIKHGQLDQKEIDAYIEHLFEQGYQVEELAEKYIKDHLIPKYGVSEEDILLQPSQIEEPDNPAKGRYEARTDVLIKNPKTGKWDMYEIKSSTKVDKTHRYDATFQTLVFEKYYELGNIYILHLNKDYERDGELSLKELFIAENVDEHVEKLRDEVKQGRYEAYLVAKAEHLEAVPACIRPKTCPCLSLCHPKLSKYSIYDVNNLTANEKKIRDLESEEIISVYDIPIDFKLSNKQRFQVNVAQSKKVHIDKLAIQQKLDELVFPLYFVDYETFNPAIPMYDGYKPYDQMTFQYSLHVLESKDTDIKTGLQHYKYIESTKSDPIPVLLSSLESCIGKSGSIIVWNKSFEATQNKRMGEIYPEFESLCVDMNDRMFDLMEIFRDQLYADPKFKGSYSIKKVLPVLIPDLTYEGLDIGDGATAMASWHDMVYGKGLSHEEKQSIKKGLLKYCELDTLAMVRIWEKLNKGSLASDYM